MALLCAIVHAKNCITTKLYSCTSIKKRVAQTAIMYRAPCTVHLPFTCWINMWNIHKKMLTWVRCNAAAADERTSDCALSSQQPIPVESKNVGDACTSAVRAGAPWPLQKGRSHANECGNVPVLHNKPPRPRCCAKLRGGRPELARAARRYGAQIVPVIGRYFDP